MSGVWNIARAGSTEEERRKIIKGRNYALDDFRRASNSLASWVQPPHLWQSDSPAAGGGFSGLGD
jgi:hypothetical protein